MPVAGRFLKASLATAALAVLAGGLLQSQPSRMPGDWPAYGATNAGSKYSPLDQINKDTAKGLQIAWRQSALPAGRPQPTHRSGSTAGRCVRSLAS